MQCLTTIFKPLQHINLIEIFEPQFKDGTSFYPVKIDGLITTFENVGIHEWTAKGLAAALTPEVIQYIGGLIEDREL